MQQWFACIPGCYIIIYYIVKLLNVYIQQLGFLIISVLDYTEVTVLGTSGTWLCFVRHTRCPMSHVHSVFQEADLRYTYCPDYHHSMTVVPVNEEALDQRQKEEALQCWKTPAGWIFPGKKTMRESNVHSKKPHPARVDDIHKVGFIHCKLDMQNSARFLAPNLKGRELSRTVALLAPNPKGLGAYNLDTVRTYVRTSVDSDFSEGYGLNSLKLYTKIRYGLRIMHVKYIFDIIQNGGLAAILDVNTLGAHSAPPQQIDIMSRP